MRFKRVLCAVSAVCICCSAFGGAGVLAAADHDTADVKANYDFESSLEFSSSCAKRTDTKDIHHKYAMEIFPTAGTSSSIKKFAGLEKDVKTTLSFDFMAKQSDHIFRMALHDGSTVYGSIYWDHAGRMLFSLNGMEPSAISAYNTYSQQQAIVPYKANEWHNVSVVINPAGTATTIDYYDGVNVGTCRTNRSATGNFDSLYLTSTQGGYNIDKDDPLNYDGDEGLYIDNLRVSQGEPDFYAAAKDDEGFVRVEFSEQLSKKSNIEEISLINTVTGEEAAIAEIINEGRLLYIVPSEKLVNANEYMISFPDNIASANGKDLSSKTVYFTSAHGASAISWETEEPLFYADFENLPLGSAEKNDAEWNTVIAAGTVNGVSCEEQGGNKFVRFTNETGATYLRFQSNGRWADDAAYDRIVVEADISMPEIKRSADILFVINTKTYGQCFFDSFGRFVAVSGSAFDSAEDTDGEYPETHTVYELSQEAGRTYRLSCRIDKKEQTIDYYIDGEFAARASWNEQIANPRLAEVRVKANTGTGMGGAIDFDNFTVAHTKSNETVSKMRLFAKDGESWGPAAQDVIPAVSQGRLEFSCAIDPASADDGDIVISDGDDTVPVTITQRGANFITFSPGSFLKANTNYTISVSGINAANGIALAEYTAYFKTSGVKSVDILNFRLENAAGGKIMSIADIADGTEVILKAEISNSTDKDITVRPILTQAADNILLQTAEDEVYIKSGEAKEVSVRIIAKGGNNAAVCAMLADADYAPMCAAIECTNMTEPEDGDWTVVYNGELKSGRSGELVFADILLPGKTRADIASEERIDTVLAYRAQTISGEGGKFSIKFKLKDDPNIDEDAVSGKYKVLFAGADEVSEDEISFSNANEAADLTAKLNAAAAQPQTDAVAAIKDTIENNPDALGLGDKSFAQLDLNKFAVMVYNGIKTGGELEDAKSLCGKCMAILLTADGKADNLFSYAEELDLANSKIGKLYTMKFVTESLQKEITSKLRAKSFSKTEEFYDALTEAFVLAAVEHPDGTQNVRTVIEELCAEIPIDSAKAKNAPDSVYSKIANKSYGSCSKLAAAFNSAYNDANKTVNGGGSSGGGSTTSGGVKSSISGAVMPSGTITSIPESIFDDIDSVLWAKDSIISLAEKKIISGKGENKFCPNDNITREEFTKLVVSAFLRDAEPADIAFDDVSADSWSYSFVARAYGADIVSGYSDTYFGAKENITRQDMAAILYRAAKRSGIVFSGSVEKRFADESSIPEYAQEAVNTLYNANVVSGTSEAEFDGASFATRAQAAKMIDGLLNL